jgi:hypothetical protein
LQDRCRKDAGRMQGWIAVSSGEGGGEGGYQGDCFGGVYYGEREDGVVSYICGEVAYYPSSDPRHKSWEKQQL